MQSNRILFVLFVAVLGHVSGQIPNSIDDVKDSLKHLKESLPELDNIPLESFNKSILPKAEDVEKLLREKCEKHGALDAIDLLKEQQDSARLCVEKYINFTVVQAELDKAEKTGSMDEVFAKYCSLWPEIMGCFDNVTSIARKCMDEKEGKAFNKTVEIVAELKEFMCFKDGDRLAMFVAEGGVECVKERKDGITQCLNKTLGARIPDSDDLSLTSMPMFLYSTQDCQDFDAVRTCIIEELERCKDSTPANIMDAFFKFLKKQMPCKSEEAVMSRMDPAQISQSFSTTANLLLIVSVLAFQLF